MDQEIKQVFSSAKISIEGAGSQKELDEAYLEIFGRNGSFISLTKKLSAVDPADKPRIGKLLNRTKKNLEDLFVKQKSRIRTKEPKEQIDITAPGIKTQIGHLHLVSQAIEEIVDIFKKLGFSLQSYPEIDWDWYAFESLNMPKNHPARDDWETFFVKSASKPHLGSQVLTPHTSNGQVREMERVKKSLPAHSSLSNEAHPSESKTGRQSPIRMLNIARCYRRQVDVSHTPMFHQFEGMLIDERVAIPDLKGTLNYFSTQFFGPSRLTRLRQHHFRFTEPSFEVDVTCGVCLGRGCRFCKSGWVELGGAGMIHPNVLASGKIDPQKYTGFAFGWGVERTIAMKTDLGDIRLLYQNDLRFLEQF